VLADLEVPVVVLQGETENFSVEWSTNIDQDRNPVRLLEIPCRFEPPKRFLDFLAALHGITKLQGGEKLIVFECANRTSVTFRSGNNMHIKGRCYVFHKNSLEAR
jgi:hypothetical protein